MAEEANAEGEGRLWNTNNTLMETEGEGGGVSAKKVHEESARGWLVPSTLALDI